MVDHIHLAFLGDTTHTDNKNNMTEKSHNILDVDSAFEIVKCFDGPACSVIKHTNPCGVAQAATLSSAFRDAWKSDPVSAFGSIIGFNIMVDAETAELDTCKFLNELVKKKMIMLNDK